LLLSATTFADPGRGEYFGPRLIREEVRIPAPGGYTIAATILRPDGPGPYGAVVLNHGFPGTEEEREAESWRAFSTVAPVFARRGYVVVMPLRRGFGATAASLPKIRAHAGDRISSAAKKPRPMTSWPRTDMRAPCRTWTPRA